MSASEQNSPRIYLNSSIFKIVSRQPIKVINFSYLEYCGGGKINGPTER